MIHLFRPKRDQDELALPFGADSISSADVTSHFLVAGATGSGKTVTINRLMRAVVPHIQEGADWRALVYDGKTELVSALKSFGLPDTQLYILHPFDARAYAWDLASDIRTPGEIQELSQILFPPEKTHTPFFENAANDLLQGVILSLAHRFGTNWTLRDVLLAMRQSDWLQQILGWAPDQNSARQLLYFKNDRTANDVMATIRTKVAPFEVVAAHWHEAFINGRKLSLHAWAEQGGVIVLGHSHKSTEALRRVNRIIFKRVTQILLDYPNVAPHDARRRSWFFLDEVGKAGKLAGLEELILKGRSKGVVVVLGFQDISSLEKEDAYGRATTEEIVSAIANKAVLRLEGAYTAKWAERLFGNEDATYTHRSWQAGGAHATISRTEHRDVRPVVLDAELLSIPFRDRRGIGGFYKTVARDQVYFHWIPPQLIAKNPVGNPAQDFLPADASCGILKPWTKDELAHMKLMKPRTRTPRRNPALDDTLGQLP